MTICDLNCIVCRFYCVQTNLQWKLHLHILWMATPHKRNEMTLQRTSKYINSFFQNSAEHTLNIFLTYFWNALSGPFSSVVPRRHDFRSWLHHFWKFTRTVRQLPNSFHNIKMLIVLYIYGPSFLSQKTRRLTSFERHWKRKSATILAVCRRRKKKLGTSLWTQTWTWRKATHTTY